MSWVRINDIINWMKYKKNIIITINDINNIIIKDTKTRYSISNDGMLIRCNQGHSIKSVIMDLELYQDVGNPVIHGTYFTHYNAINKYGLKCMSRNHIHMIEVDTYNSTNWKLIRNNVDMYVIINVEKAINDGIVFYRSQNNVILTNGINGTIPPKYLTLIKTTKAFVYGFIVRYLNQIIVVTTSLGHKGFPKGKKHNKEHGLACAYRELYEETGLLPSDIIIQETKNILMDNNMVLYLADCKETSFSKKLCYQDPDELVNVEWMSIPKLLSLPNNQFCQSRKSLLTF